MKKTIISCDNCGADMSDDEYTRKGRPRTVNIHAPDVCGRCFDLQFIPLPEEPRRWPKVVTSASVIEWMKLHDRTGPSAASPPARSGQPGYERDLELAILNISFRRDLNKQVKELQERVRRSKGV